MRKNLSGLLLLVSLLNASNAQEARYMVTNYDLRKHLSATGSVWCMVQDTLGVLYFGIEGGIGTFDGAEWTKYHQVTEVIRSLFVDSGGNIWYGGVNDFGKVTRSPTEGIKLESIASLFPDSVRQFGDLWSIAEADSKIFFQAGKMVFTISDRNKTDWYRVKDSYHRGFSFGDKYFLNERGRGVLQFSGNGFTLAPGGSFFGDKIISGAVELNSDTLLLGTRDEGLFKWSPSTGNVQPFRFDDTVAESFLRKNRIYHMTSLPDGNLAFASLLNGTLIIDRRGRLKKVLHYQSGVQDNAHYYLGLSHDNNLWMCTGNGISVYNIFSPFSNWDYSKGVEGVVMSIRSHDGGILVGTLTGLFYLPDPGASGSNVQRLLDSEVWDIFPLSSGENRNRMVISAGNGLWLLAGMNLTNIFRSDLILKSMSLQYDPSLLLSFGANTLHVSRVSNDGVSRLRTMEGLFTEYRSSAQESDRYIWVGTRSQKMYRISQGSLLTAINNNTSLPPEKIGRFGFSIPADVHSLGGRIIFSSNEGFMTYDSLNSTFIRCNSLGPDVANYRKMVSAMIPDQQGNIWIGGNELLLNRQDGTYSLYLLPFDPVREIFSAFVFYHDTEGRTWIGGNKGLYLYDRSVIDPADHLLPVIINRVVKEDSAVYVTALSCPETDCNTITFENGRDISIFYSLPGYRGDTGKEYSWTLEGYTDGWSRWNSQNFAAFNSLPPGSYIFSVKGRTLDRETDASCITILIKRPWYSSITARLIYLVIILALLYAVNSFIVRRRLRRELLMENIIQQRVQQSIIWNIIPGNSSIELPDTENRPSQSEPEGFSVPVLQEESSGRDNQFMNRLLDAIEENIDDCELSVEKLCSIMNMSQTMLYRKLKAYTGLSITSFIRKVRLKKAAQILLQTSLAVSEVAYRVGFNDPGYFSKCFREEFGQSPKSFQKNLRHGETD